MKNAGARLRLRPVEQSDAESLLQLNIENRDFFGPRSSPQPDEYFTLEGQLAHIERAQKMLAEQTGVILTARLLETDELIGFVAVFGVLRGGFQEARIGYNFSERYGGKGFASEAVELAVPYAFETLDLHRLETGVQLDNPASMRVLTKAGFREEGISLGWVKTSDGRWHDAKRFALTREEWEERARAPRQP